MKLLYISIIFCFFSSAIYAQANYQEGYVLKNNGDTLKGYINYHEWERSPKVIDFKTAIADKKPIQFHPADVKAFGITGMETYVSYAGYISTNKTEFPDYPQQIDTSKVLDTIFLRQVATGKNITLYYNKDKIKVRFFMSETHTEPVELNYYIYYINDTQVTNAPVYTGQLRSYISKYAPANNKLLQSMNSMIYDQTHLEEFTNTINNVKADNNKNKKKFSRLFWGIGITNVSTQANPNVDITYTTHSISPKINFGVDMFSNPNVQQFVFRVEGSLWYAMPRFYINTNNVYLDNTPNNSVYEFNQYNATITPQILLNLYNKQNLKFYINGGWAFNFSSYSNNQTTVNTGTTSSTVTKPIDLQRIWTAFPIQVGMVLNKKIEIYASHSFYATYTQYIYLFVANQTTSVGINYLLK